MADIDPLLSEARDLAVLICPLPQQVDDGDAIERMPDDLLRAATMIGKLCDALIERTRERDEATRRADDCWDDLVASEKRAEDAERERDALLFYLVQAINDEREACARLIEAEGVLHMRPGTTRAELAAAIRARP